MPRPNQGRTAPYEEYVAANLVRERERAGLTYQGLAARMTSAGCPIQPSALHKIEKGDPPRRVTVNELFTMSSVLGIPASDLAGDPRATPQELWEEVLRVEEQQRVIDLALQTITAAADRLRPLLDADPGLRTVLRRYLADNWSDWPEVRAHFRDVLRSPRKAID